jgi:hypothetical protein
MIMDKAAGSYNTVALLNIGSSHTYNNSTKQLFLHIHFGFLR